MNQLFEYKHSLRRRFTLAAVLMLVPLVVLVVVQYSVFNSTIARLNDALEHGSKELASIKQVQNVMHLALMAPNDYLVHGDKAERENYAVLSAKVSTSIINIIKFMSHHQGEQSHNQSEGSHHQREHDLMMQADRLWIQVDDRARNILASTNPVGNRALAMEMESQDALAEEAISVLGQAYDVAVQEMAEEMEEAETLRTIMIALIVGGTSVSAILILWLNRALARAVVRPISCIKGAANRVGEGNYNTRLFWQRQDEIGELSQSFDAMTEQLEKAHNKLELLSRQDGLTGILNRREFDRLFRVEFSRAVRFKHSLSLIMIDLDHFKEINDRHGHLAGDNVLRILTTLVEKTIRDIDQFARYGGEEFSLILPEVDGKSACILAERIRKLVEGADFGEADGEPVHVTISAGVADYPEHGASEKDVIYSADKALYKAKRDGRNRVVCAGWKTSNE